MLAVGFALCALGNSLLVFRLLALDDAPRVVRVVLDMTALGLLITATVLIFRGSRT